MSNHCTQLATHPIVPLPERLWHRLWTLVRKLTVDNTARLPYSKKAADKIRHLLEEQGRAETLRLGFHLLLHLFEEQAHKRREELEKRAQEHEEREDS